MSATFWTEERVEILKRRRDAQWSAGAIARLLGCTRNAVIGKADRLGLLGSGPSARSRASSAFAHGASADSKPGVARAPSEAGSTRHGGGGPAAHLRTGRVMRLPLLRPPVRLPPGEGEPPSRRIALVDLEPGECGWISGDDGRCCGHATVRIVARGGTIASPYCGFHSARAYRVARAGE